MNVRVALLSILFLAFSALTVVATLNHGYMGIIGVGLSNTAGAQVFVDLIIGCGIACGFIIVDAKQRGLNPWPFLAIAPFLGSFAPLLYLIRREWT